MLELRSDKRTQMAQLKNEYLRLGQPMHDCSLLDLVRRVEIEFSKDKTFEVGRGRGFWDWVGCSGFSESGYSGSGFRL